MRAVNLIPADQRGGASVGAGRSQGAAYAVLGLLAGLAVMAAALRPRRATRSRATRRKRRRSPHAPSRRRPPPAALAPVHELRRAAPGARRSGRAARRLPLRLGPRLPRVRPRAPRERVHLVAQRHACDDGHRRRARASSRRPASRPPAPPPARLGLRERSASASAASAAVTSATPPGSVPTFTVSGCATSQAAVARDAQPPAPDRRRRERDAPELDQGRLRRRQRERRRRLPADQPAFTLHGHLPAAAHRQRRPRAASATRPSPVATTGSSQEAASGAPMTGRDRIVVMVLGVLAVLAAAWMLVVSPERQKAEQARRAGVHGAQAS